MYPYTFRIRISSLPGQAGSRIDDIIISYRGPAWQKKADDKTQSSNSLTLTLQLFSYAKHISAMAKGPLERKLKFEKKNEGLIKLPKRKSSHPRTCSQRPKSKSANYYITDAKVEKRPIPHAPVASPYVGASVPKIVYISSSTPFMSAVKRIQKLLLQAEKRATANINLEDTRKSEKQILDELSKVSEKREEVFAKATGRAIEKALNVAKWFEEKQTEYAVRVKTGSVLVVDDIVEDEDKKEKEQKRQKQEGQPIGQGDEPSKLESKSVAKKRKRRAAAEDDGGELPESRTRWIRMVEVAISLK